MPLNLATIIQEKSFEKQFDIIIKKYKRLNDVHAALDWVLARDPEQGTIIDDEIRVLKTTSLGAIPSFWVLYQYDKEKNTVYLLSIKPIEQSQEI